jgi:hypothetical protein
VISLSGAFITRFEEEEEIARRMSHGGRRERVELFVEAMKYELAKVLMPEVVPNATISLPQSGASSAQQPKEQ